MKRKYIKKPKPPTDQELYMNILMAYRAYNEALAAATRAGLLIHRDQNPPMVYRYVTVKP